MKKIIKIIGLSLLIILALLIAAPFLFQKQIKDTARNYINQNVNANVTFNDINLSFLSSFPQANINLDNLTITTLAPFKNDTLAKVKSLSLDMSISELFKKTDEEPIILKSIAIDNALINLKSNAKGETNWDIAKATEKVETKTDTTSNGFAFDIEDYSITDSQFNYLDEASKTQFKLTNLNHSGSGTFSGDTSQLDTHTDTNVTLNLDNTEYLSDNNIKLDALIGLDLTNNTYTFKENKGHINNLPLEFKGQIKLKETGQDIDITFNNPGASFKDFLAVIPKTYAKDLDHVTTKGNFKVNGIIKGEVTETKIPTLDINITSNNASFKFEDLPKQVENISIDTQIKNKTGNPDDTYVNLKKLNFKIDEDLFKSSATIKNLTKNIAITASIDGVLNLANLTKAYPLELKNKLKGILDAKLNTSFDMNAIETNAYNRIKNNGTMQLSDFVFSSTDIVNPINISKAEVNFKPGLINLDNFTATTGKTDLNATGKINNLLGFLLSDKKLKGDFDVKSNHFLISDFMIEGGSDAPVNQSTEPATSLKIPAFLDCNITADAKTVYYDNLILKNVKGQLKIADEKAQLNNVTSNIFNGNLNMEGLVDTKTKQPTFNMKLGAKNFDISQSVKDLSLLQALAPISKALKGKLNSTIGLSGKLGDDFTPLLNSVTGDAFAELLTTKIQTKDQEILSLLENKLSFLDFNKLDIEDLKTKLTFKDGKVNVAPFDITYEDVKMTIDGSHTFSNTMNYQIILDVPGKYLGNDVNKLISSINDPKANNLTVPVTATITGNTLKPKVNTDLTSGIKSLTNQLIAFQKQKLINKGKDKLNDAIGDIFGSKSENDSNKPKKDSIKTETPKDQIKNILGGIIKGNQKPKDSTLNDSVKTKDPVKDILGGLFGK